MAAVFPLGPDIEVVGELEYVKARQEEGLSDIAAHFGVSDDVITWANPGLDPSRPRPGAWVTVPSQFILPKGPREGLVINLPERRLYYYVRPVIGREAEVISFPIRLGKRAWSHSLGLTHVEAKLESQDRLYADRNKAVPAAARPTAARDYAVRLAFAGCLLEAGAANAGPASVRGPCILLRPSDMRTLYHELSEGTPVRMVDQPFKAGWRNGELYLEVHPPLNNARHVSDTPAVRTIVQATAAHRPDIDWNVVSRAVEEARGVPVRISR